MMVAMVHALVFGLIYYIAHRSVYMYFNPMRRFEGMDSKKDGLQLPTPTKK
jgi:hypothetical protein